LRDAKTTVDFHGTDPVLIVGNHPHGGEPFVEAYRRVLADRSDLR
jgi:hypothetical protein